MTIIIRTENPTQIIDNQHNQTQLKSYATVGMNRRQDKPFR